MNRDHPLIAPALAPSDWQAVDPAWQAADHDPDQHGTGMAGIALYRCLTDVLAANGPVHLRHRLESLKLLPPHPQANAPEVYGSVTQQAVSAAELSAPQRKRAICMAVTTDDDRDDGFPSSWSAAVDQMCAGQLDDNPKLLFISEILGQRCLADTARSTKQNILAAIEEVEGTLQTIVQLAIDLAGMIPIEAVECGKFSEGGHRCLREPDHGNRPRPRAVIGSVTAGIIPTNFWADSSSRLLRWQKPLADGTAAPRSAAIFCATWTE